jgi:O-antigen ligase
VAFVIALLPLSLVAVFEMVKSWHLYSDVIGNWGGVATYSARVDLLRASATALGPIVFGFVAMASLGYLLAVWDSIASRQIKVLALAILLGGLGASFSRGPWIGAIILLIAYAATGSGPIANFGRVALAGAVGGLAILMLAPGVVRIASILPFASIDPESVDYRQQLFENAVKTIARNPWLGSKDYWYAPEMQALIQGQNIIDIVNHYLKIALDSGLVGLALFVAFFAVILLALRRVIRFDAVRDPDLGTGARAVLATLVAILATIATVSSIGFIPYIYWSCAALGVAFVRIAHRQRMAATRTAFASRGAV